MANNNIQPTYYSQLSELLVRRPVILQFLRFGTIGAINTAIDFLILNYLTKAFGIEVGLDLGLINIVGVAAATIQSYFWNRAWTFSIANVSPLKNFVRLFLVGSLGLGMFILVLLGSAYGFSANFYLGLLVLFLLGEIILWYGFRLSFQNSNNDKNVGQQFLEFVVVSIIGVVINSVAVVVAVNLLTDPLSGSLNTDVVKNIAKFGAILIAMIWNFIGYKLLVFKK